MPDVYFENIEDIIIENLNQANFEIKIAVAWITNKKLLRTLKECCSRGVKVSVIFYKDNINNFDNFESLHSEGAEIRYSQKLMHNKFCVIDEEIVINGSYNWTKAANRNHENIQIFNSEDLANTFLNEFDSLISQSKKIDEYFIKKNYSYNEFLHKKGYPTSFPFFLRIDLDQKLKDEFYLTKNFPFNYVYMLIQNEDYYEDFQRKMFAFYYRDKHLNSQNKYYRDFYDTPGVSELMFFYSYFESNKENVLSAYDKAFIILDIIKDDFTNQLVYDSKTIFDTNFRYSSDHFIYFDNESKLNYIIVGLTFNHYTYKLQSLYDYQKSLSVNIVKNEKSNNNLMKSIHTGTIQIIEGWVEIFERKNNITYFLDLKSFEINKRKTFESKLKLEEEEKIRKVEKINRENNIRKTNNKDCYIATMVYKDVNHSKVEHLRNFRDFYLSRMVIGNLFISYYYRNSPKFVEKYKKSKILNFIIKEILDIVIPILPKG